MTAMKQRIRDSIPVTISVRVKGVLEMLEDKVDYEGDVKAFIVCGDEDAVFVLLVIVFPHVLRVPSPLQVSKP